MRNDFVALILTHGRPNVLTTKTLRKCGYTGRIIYVLDDEDKTRPQYELNYGSKDIALFSKDEMERTMDMCDNGGSRAVAVYARNACFDIAKKFGYKYFMELDDDYTAFDYTYASKEGDFKCKGIKNLDNILEYMLEYYESIPALAIAMAQAGDFIGGAGNQIIRNQELKRKCMNTWLCSVERPFKFLARMNDDVTTYITIGNRGGVFLQVPQVNIVQEATQKVSGGMTEVYRDSGTYLKTFYSVINEPSFVKVSQIGYRHRRIHHNIDWAHGVPKIVAEELRKGV